MAATGVLAPSVVALGAAPAGATNTAGLPPALQKFAHCPVDNMSVTACLFSSVTGTFQVNSTTLKATSPATLNLGLISNGTSTTVVLPTDGTPALQSPPIQVPGGLLGIPGSMGPLAVTATPELAGLPTLDLANLYAKKGAAVVLPLQTLLSNPLLGSNCTIGDSSNPMTLRLTDGTTKPPPPNQPIKGALGKISSGAYNVLIDRGSKLVDNAFAAPGAYNCGVVPALYPIIDPIVDLDKGLPSAAGTNSAILHGNTYIVAASTIRQYLG